MTTTYLNRNFRFVYSPKLLSFKIYDNKGDVCGEMKQPPFFSKRFLVGAGSLKNWISEKNAETVFKSAQKMKTDKMTLKFRKYGKIEIYVK